MRYRIVRTWKDGWSDDGQLVDFVPQVRGWLPWWRPLPAHTESDHFMSDAEAREAVRRHRTVSYQQKRRVVWTSEEGNIA